MVVGSLASSARGVYRATADGDLLAQIAPWDIVRLADALGAEWYADRDQMERAFDAGRSFNLIHIPTAQKIDIFPADTEFHESQLQRATAVSVFPGETQLVLPVASAEDTVLAKLQWYRAGGEISDRQWNDITGLIATNPTLDGDYLQQWANRLRVKDLLDRASCDAAGR